MGTADSPTSGELAKSYDPGVEEPKVRAAWEAARPFHAEPVADGPPPYCILIPPPNVTAALHLGHALNNTLQDVLIRYHRAQGRPTLWMPGTDHAGIATQAVIEKRIWEDQGKRRKDLDPDTDKAREKFVAITQAWKDEYEATIIEQLKLMGCSCDWDRTRFTMDEMCARAVREAFFRLFRDGLIYRGKRLVNWDPVLQTAVADDECYDEEIDGFFYYLRYPLIGEPVKLPDGRVIDHITVATTRPETMLGDTGVALNPKDPRATTLKGRSVKLPLVGRVIPIVADDYVVLPVSMGGDEKDPKAQFATGFLKVTPAHDPNDWEIGQRHSLAAINIFAPDASISDKHGWTDVGDAGFLVGLDRFEARKAIVKRFEETGVLAERKPYRHSVSHSDRSKAIIEPYLSDQWYVKVTDDRMRGHALRAMAAEQRTHEMRSIETSRACQEAVLDARNTVRPPAIGKDATAEEAQRPETSRACKEAVLDDQPTLDFRCIPTVPYPVYFLTWTTFGTWLHGDERGAVDRHHNERHTPFLEEDERRRRNEQERAGDDAFALDPQQRRVVCAKIDEVCNHRGWLPLAINVRSNHVHVVVSATSKDPEDVMTDFKAYATRGLIQAGTVARGSKVWTRHGSTKWLNDAESVKAACRYVLLDQGENQRGTVSGACCTGDRPTPLPDGRGSSGQALTGGEVEAQSERRSRETSRACEEAALAEQRFFTADPGNGAGAQGALGDAPWKGQLRFYPDRYAKTFENWHENIRDWCISRQLWWGHRIPVWHVLLETNWIGHEYGVGSTHSDDPCYVESFSAAFRAFAVEASIENEYEIRPNGVAKAFICARTKRAHDVLIAIEQYFGQASLKQVGGTKPLSGWPAHPKGLAHCSESASRLWYFILTFTQDPDVLDTWFSSALWPLSTMGWPDPESYDETRAKDGAPNLLDFFNPTSVLCTAREIITLWVSRMVMFNLYFTADTDKGRRLPFRDVFIHAMIQDGEGRKMSKSLGNGVDPRDIIRSKGADAMRFTLVQMTTQTQDVRMPVEYDETIGANTSPKFELGRRLANKIWNATRFAIAILSAKPDAPPDAEPSRLIDSWMLSRLARTLEAVEQAVARYEFNVYAQQMYDLFWRDFCDWYLEGVKPTVRGDPVQQRVLRSALGVIHRMFHPIMPFVTESLHAAIESLPVEPLEGIELRPSDLAATARWPIMPDVFIDDEAEREFARAAELVSIIREVRSVQKVHERRLITLHVADDATMELIAAAQGVIESLAGLGQVTRQTASGQGVTFLFGNVEHALTDLTDAVDLSAERARLSRQRTDLEKRIAGLRGRLDNKGYTEKAPPRLVEETKQQLSEAESELASIIQALGKLNA